MLRLIACLLCIGSLAYAGEPASPFKRKPSQRARNATVILSNETRITGKTRTTIGKPWRIFHRADSKYVDVDFSNVVSADVAVEKEVIERVWRWKESASDEKVYTDKYYIWQKYVTTLTLRDGTVLKGDLQARVYVNDGQKKHSLDLHKRCKGKVTTKDKLKPPVYIRRIVFDDTNKQ